MTRMEQTGLVFPVEPEPEQDQEPDECEPETYDERCQWCGDAFCEGACPDNPFAEATRSMRVGP